MQDVSDLSSTIVAKSDQLNADDLLAGPITVSIIGVSAGAPDQPVSIKIDGGHQPYKPCKTMRRVLISAWGKNGNDWVGRSMTLFNDPAVLWAGKPVGGIRISHLSDMPKDMNISLAITRGKKTQHNIGVIKNQGASNPSDQNPAYPPEKFLKALPVMLEQINSGKMTRDAVIAQCEKTGTLTEDQKAQLVQEKF